MKKLLAVAAAATTAAVFARGAGATYPGKNGLIAFNAVTADGSSQIFTVRDNGKDLRQITHLPGDAAAPDWSPDGRKIVFELDTDVGAAIYTMTARGSDLRAITAPADCCSGQPSYTPDGRRIVFERFDPNTFDDGVWIMNADGSGVRHLVSPYPGGSATDPNVSPDGTTLTFVGWDAQLVGGPPNFEPAQNLVSTPLAGGPLTQLLPFEDDLAIKHDWSPAGRRLLADVNANFFHQGDSANIVTLRPDGSGLAYLTHFSGGAVNAFAGSYSPDGRYIVYRLEDHGLYSLLRMDADGSHVETILPPSGFRPRNVDWGSRFPGEYGGER